MPFVPLENKMRLIDIDGPVKAFRSVTPAKAGVQKSLLFLDSGVRRIDEKAISDSLRTHQF
jgi:hypothetical protein